MTVEMGITKDADAPVQKLWQKTPLIRSSALSERTGHEVYLKIETFQTSGSFKGRGISHFANQATRMFLQQRSPGAISAPVNLDTRRLAQDAATLSPEEWMTPFPTSHVPEDDLPHLIIASGGNAGLAAASAAGILGVKCTVFVPDAQKGIEHLFTRHGKEGSVNVVVGGENYRAALMKAVEFKEEIGDKGVLVPAYDDPLVWQGNSSLAHEIAEQLPDGVKPDAIFCSVGGGGMIAGLMLGCEGIPGWNQVPIVAIEPTGSACFYHSVQLNRTGRTSTELPAGASISNERIPHPFAGTLTPYASNSPYNGGDDMCDVSMVHLPSINSYATSLGASTASNGSVCMALKRDGPISVVRVSDERSMQSALLFADDHSVITELACSITLTPAYVPHLARRVLRLDSDSGSGALTQQSNVTGHDRSPKARKVLVFIVCGGSKGSLHDLQRFEEHLSSFDFAGDDIWVDGERLAGSH